MRAIDLNNKLIESYLELLKNLSSKSKSELINRLTSSLQDKKTSKPDKFEKAFGAWDKSEKAEDITNVIRESRTFYRTTEEF